MKNELLGELINAGTGLLLNKLECDGLKEIEGLETTKKTVDEISNLVNAEIKKGRNQVKTEVSKKIDTTVQELIALDQFDSETSQIIIKQFYKLQNFVEEC